MDEVELDRLGLIDVGVDRTARLALLQYLTDLGATVEDLVAEQERLPSLSALLALRGGAGMTVREVAERTSLPEEEVYRFLRSAGFPRPEPDAAVLAPAVAEVVASLQAADELFGRDAIDQIVRVMGAGMARLADALVTQFLVNVEPAVRVADDAGLSVARANADVAALAPLATSALDVLLRQHLIAARRTILFDEFEPDYETRPLAVGFVDLADSTALANRLSTGELGAVLAAFELLAVDAVTDGGGRVVKLIGDAVLFTAVESVDAATIALRIAEAAGAHDTVPGVRAGVALGPVVLRDGDVFGPVVNLAARILAVADPGEVVVAEGVVAPAGTTRTPLGTRTLKGFADPVELFRLGRVSLGP